MKILFFETENCNTYIYYDESTLDAVVIDAGKDSGYLGGEFIKIEDEVNKLGLKINGILLTHCHFDHIFSADFFREAFNAKIYLEENEAALASDEEKNVSQMFGIGISVVADELLRDGDTIMVGNSSLRVISTPGHTAGSMCLLDLPGKVVFSGDTLFLGDVGRIDLPTGNENEMLSSLKKLAELPGDIKVYPGHGRSTTIAQERYRNVL